MFGTGTCVGECARLLAIESLSRRHTINANKISEAREQPVALLAEHINGLFGALEPSY